MELEKLDIYEFVEWAKEVFIKIQKAKNNNDLDSLIRLESSFLFERDAEIIRRNTLANRREVRDCVVINYAKINEYECKNNYDFIRVEIKASLENYTQDITTGEVVSGIKDYKKTNIYIVTFVRRGNITGNTKMKCDSCGADVNVAASGKCEYCGNIFYMDVHDLVVGEIEVLEED